MKKIIMLLFIGIIVLSCQDEEEKNTLEGSYKLSPTATLGKVRMYTSKGEVTDEAKIKQFLSKKSDSFVDYTEFFSFDSSSRNIGDEIHLDITFYPDKAVVQTDILLDYKVASDVPYDASVFNYSNLFIVSKGKSDMDIPVRSITEFFEKDGIEKISMNSHYLEEPMLPGIVSQMSGRINFALLEQNRQFVLPFLTYMHGRYLQHDNKFYYTKTTCNILNTDYLTHIPVSDTIVVQESWAVLQKQ